jgi:hypothetical protein
MLREYFVMLKKYYFASMVIVWAGLARRRNPNSWVVLTGISILILCFSVQRAMAADVPFSTGYIIEGNFDGAMSVLAADIDGDNDLDILGTAKESGDIIWWENTKGIGTVWTAHLVDGDSERNRNIDFADIDGDGDLDILGSSIEGSSYPYDCCVIWWENTNGLGTDWSKHVVDDNFGYIASDAIHAADIDGDGDVDIVTGNSFAGNNNIVWFENANGLGTSWTMHSVDSSFERSTDLHAADVDGDNDLDIIGGAWSEDEITWWENADTSGTNWIKHTVDDNVHAPSSTYAIDMDGDNDIDILGTSYNDGFIAWWENTNGSGTAWTKHNISSGFIDGASSVYAADIDADGDLDVLGTAFWAHDIAWWENTNGNATAWTMHLLDGDFSGVTDAYAADIDGDSDLDILGTAILGDDLVLWKNLTLDPPTPCADFSGDLFVNLRDFAFLAEEWLQEGDLLQTDLIYDNKINELDLAAFVEQWLTPCYQCSQADIYSDGKIDFKDYSLLAGNWQREGLIASDITGDGIVDMDDLKVIIFYWLKNCE